MKNILTCSIALLLPSLAILRASPEKDALPVELSGALPPPGFYPRLVEPSEYPAYHQRAFPVPTWSTFDNRPQFVAGRHIPEKDFTADQIVAVPDPEAVVAQHRSLTFFGRMCRSDASLVLAPEPEFSDVLRHVNKLGMSLFDLAGYGPSFPPGNYGQLHVTPSQTAAMTDILGDRWLGFNVGEQDGRYHNGFAGRQLPAPRDRVGQHLAFRNWCDRMIDDLGGKVSLLTTLWGWHYPVQDGAVTLIGAECENRFGITAPQVQYAFLRGAGKQYGVLWYGDQSIFSTFGLTYWELGPSGELVHHAGGPSSNLLRRVFLSEWLWNSCVLGFEGATVAADKPRTKGRPSPIGQIQIATEKMIQQGFTTGVMQTPVAIVQDYFSGWMPSRTNTTQFHAFNALPYQPGDYLTDNLLKMIFPDYASTGFFFDESGTMCPTPYGDVADCLLSDAPSEVLSRYNLVLCSGIESDIQGTRERLDAFLHSGGTVLVTGNDAARLWPEFCSKETIDLPAGTTVQWKGGVTDHEANEFSLHLAPPIPNAETLATCEGHPAVVRVPAKGGTLLLALSSTGMNRSAIPRPPSKSPMMGGGENTKLERPFELLSHVQRTYDAALKAQRLFTAGDDLSVTSCRRPDGTWVIGVSNPSLVSKPFAVTSHIGEPAEIREVDLGSPVHDMPGYWPHRWGPMRPAAKMKGGETNREDLGELAGELTPSDTSHIRGGDMRFFEVKLKSCTALERPDVKLPSAPHDRLLRVPDLTTLRERLLSWPRFAYYFDGVALDAQAILDVDSAWLREHAPWFKRHRIRLLVDARRVQPEAVIDRLAAYGGGPELIVEAPNQPISAAAKNAGVTLLAPDRVRVIDAGQEVGGHNTGTIQVLAGDWRSWDSLYKDVRSAWLNDVSERIVGPGVAPSLSRENKAASGKHRWIALHSIADPALAVAERPGLLEHFDGVVLDSVWLETRSPDALKKDRDFFTRAGLSVAIDFTRSLNNFPDLTFSSTVPHRHEASQRVLDVVLDKMPALGATRALICSHNGEVKKEWAPLGSKGGDSSKDDQPIGIERFLDRAASLGITVDWRTSSVRPPGKLAEHAKLVSNLRGAHPNLRIAASTVDEPDPAKLLAAIAPAGPPELWLLAAPAPREGRSGVQFRPLTTLPKAQVDAMLAAAKDATVVFDADYLNWSETLADCEHAK